MCPIRYYDHFLFAIELLCDLGGYILYTHALYTHAGPLDVMLRSLMIGQMGKYDHAETVQEAKKKFDCHVCGSEPLQADLKSAVFSTCIANGDENTFDQLIKVHSY